jgi:hypothetical protein
MLLLELLISAIAVTARAFQIILTLAVAIIAVVTVIGGIVSWRRTAIVILVSRVSCMLVGLGTTVTHGAIYWC